MKRLFPLLLLPSALAAHVMSMSSGDLTIRGTEATYELRMPLYEVAHTRDPARTLLDQITFSSGGRPARLLERSCREDSEAAAYICSARYRFEEPVDSLDVECRLHTVTVPNHVHLLRVENGDKRDQAIFDFSFPQATLRFTPPGAAEVALSQAGAGFMRAGGGPAQVLFLAALVMAARSRRELAGLGAAFLAGQCAAVVMVPLTGWEPAVRFVEAAAALTVAYLAVEILLLPAAGYRWLIVAVLGVFHGLYFDLFLRTSGFAAGWVLAGAAAAELALIAVFALIFSRVARLAAALRPLHVSASLLLVFGLAWFFLRLRG
jgi:hypothetical protein